MKATMTRALFCSVLVALLTACASTPDNHRRFKEGVEVSDAEFNHDLLICSDRYSGYLASPLVHEPKSKEEFFRNCLSTLGYREANSAEEKKSFVFNFKDIQLNLIKLGK